MRILNGLAMRPALIKVLGCFAFVLAISAAKAQSAEDFVPPEKPDSPLEGVETYYSPNGKQILKGENGEDFIPVQSDVITFEGSEAPAEEQPTLRIPDADRGASIREIIGVWALQTIEPGDLEKNLSAKELQEKVDEVKQDFNPGVAVISFSENGMFAMIMTPTTPPVEGRAGILEGALLLQVDGDCETCSNAVPFEFLGVENQKMVVRMYDQDNPVIYFDFHFAKSDKN